jgi:hypothetical protein
LQLLSNLSAFCLKRCQLAASFAALQRYVDQNSSLQFEWRLVAFLAGGCSNVLRSDKNGIDIRSQIVLRLRDFDVDPFNGQIQFAKLRAGLQRNLGQTRTDRRLATAGKSTASLRSAAAYGGRR